MSQSQFQPSGDAVLSIAAGSGTEASDLPLNLATIVRSKAESDARSQFIESDSNHLFSA